MVQQIHYTSIYGQNGRGKLSIQVLLTGVYYYVNSVLASARMLGVMIFSVATMLGGKSISLVYTLIG